MSWFDGITKLASKFAGPLLGFAGDIGGTYMGNKAGAAMQDDAQAFSHAEGEIGRDWQEDMFGKEMAFNNAQSINQYRRAQLMRRTQYQTAVGDMKKAGLNPMLAYSQGGAGTPSVGAASVGGAGGATVGHSSTYQPRGYSGAVQSAFQAASMRESVKNLQAENKVITANAANIEMDTLKKQQDIVTSSASAKQLTQSVAESKARIHQIRASVNELDSRQLLQSQETELAFAKQALADAETVLTKTHTVNAEVQRKILSAEAVLKGLEIPRGEAESNFAKTWVGKNIAPAVSTAIGAVGTAAGVRSLFRPKSGR